MWYNLRVIRTDGICHTWCYRGKFRRDNQAKNLARFSGTKRIDTWETTGLVGVPL